MYTTTRFIFKYGHEWDGMDCTLKYWDSFEKAIAYAYRYARGIKFAGVTIEDENGKVVYEITSNCQEYDYRK